MSDMPTKVQELLDRTVRSVGEHFDNANVGLFVSWVDNGETYHAEYLIGNKFALQNHITKWATFSLPGQNEDPDSNF